MTVTGAILGVSYITPGDPGSIIIFSGDRAYSSGTVKDYGSTSTQKYNLNTEFPAIEQFNEIYITGDIGTGSSVRKKIPGTLFQRSYSQSCDGYLVQTQLDAATGEYWELVVSVTAGGGTTTIVGVETIFHLTKIEGIGIKTIKDPICGTRSDII